SPCPQGLGLPDVADPGDEPLVEHGVADGAQLRCCPETRQDRLVVGRLGEDVRPEPARDAVVELEDRSVPENPGVPGTTEDQPRRAEDGRVPFEHAPASAHPEMAAQDEAAVEVEEEVLADRLDAVEAAAVP